MIEKLGAPQEVGGNSKSCRKLLGLPGQEGDKLARAQRWGQGCDSVGAGMVGEMQHLKEMLPEREGVEVP